MTGSAVGRVTAMWRYPFKSMRGEECSAVEFGPLGVVGDRSYALIDAETGKVVSAKDPRRWPGMFSFRAWHPGVVPGPALVECSDGSRFSTDDPALEARLSTELGRPVRLARAPLAGAEADGYWPDHDWLAERDKEFTFQLPPGTLFDGAMIHLLTVATLDRLAKAETGSLFDAQRFRPNLVIEPSPGSSGFVEGDWVGRAILVGDAVLRIERPCPRCVMTTLEQDGLARDPRVLRAAVSENGGNVGVYASVTREGWVNRGDLVSLV